MLAFANRSQHSISAPLFQKAPNLPQSVWCLSARYGSSVFSLIACRGESALPCAFCLSTVRRLSAPLPTPLRSALSLSSLLLLIHGQFVPAMVVTVLSTSGQVGPKSVFCQYFVCIIMVVVIDATIGSCYNDCDVFCCIRFFYVELNKSP